MEIFRTNSPESGPFHFGWRRKSILKSPNPAHSTEERSFFTSSLPTQTLSAEMAMRSPKFCNSLESQNGIIDEGIYGGCLYNFPPLHPILYMYS